MTLVRWSPMRDVARPEFGSFLREFFGPESFNSTYWAPALDVQEQPEAYVLKAELPGTKAEDVKISVEDDALVIRGEKRREVEKNDTLYHHTERAYGSFERRIALSKGIARDRIEAKFRDGVLEVRVPKAEDAKPREIPIKTEK